MDDAAAVLRTYTAVTGEAAPPAPRMAADIERSVVVNGPLAAPLVRPPEPDAELAQSPALPPWSRRPAGAATGSPHWYTRTHRAQSAV
jgi:hypothetical protein